MIQDVAYPETAPNATTTSLPQPKGGLLRCAANRPGFDGHGSDGQSTKARYGSRRSNRVGPN